MPGFWPPGFLILAIDSMAPLRSNSVMAPSCRPSYGPQLTEVKTKRYVDVKSEGTPVNAGGGDVADEHDDGSTSAVLGKAMPPALYGCCRPNELNACSV